MDWKGVRRKCMIVWGRGKEQGTILGAPDKGSFYKPKITYIYSISQLSWQFYFFFFFIPLRGCGGSSKKLSVAQAESCQVGSTVFPLEFISPTTYGEGRFTCLSRDERRRTRKLLNICSLLPSPLLCWAHTSFPFSWSVLFGSDLAQQSTPPFQAQTCCRS